MKDKKRKSRGNVCQISSCPISGCSMADKRFLKKQKRRRERRIIKQGREPQYGRYDGYF